MKPNLHSIAIVGMACVYPDANSPTELWENALSQRRSFRRMPSERLRLEDYYSDNRGAPDSTYATEAALIEGYTFDRVAFRVVGETFRVVDLAHWLALDVASRALANAGFKDGEGLPKQDTGVLLGNTLTGEFSRANSLRLRWPYVRRTVEAALAREMWSSGLRQEFLAELEETYKSSFPPVGAETLAGGLSNTIAGRICNQFDLKGGGYTVDGACASSLLAVANACSALAAGDLDVAIAGGVDVSLDPFEIVGFAKTGALAVDDMRVFDQRSAGFWPGEGCGMVVLMRHHEAIAQGRRVYAVIRGWGISSDGKGGITRPDAEGQLEALRRAYRRAGFGFETVSYCEAHGTGTAVGDATELEVLSLARRDGKTNGPPPIVGSIKANIGHTKAAAGLAGLIKATMAVHTQVLPPTTGCEQPHALLTGPSPAARVLRELEPWPPELPLRASVSAMGFGGINAHLVLESVVAERRVALSPRELSFSRSKQDAELCLFAAESGEALVQKLEKALNFAARLSRAELTDLAAELQANLGDGTFRAGIIASKPSELGEKLQTLRSWLMDGVASRLDIAGGVFLGSGETQPRIGFLFPGQGSPTRLDGGAWRQRFDLVRDIYFRAELPTDLDPVSTRVMQPAVVTASLAGLKVLAEFGVCASAAVGHSLGEISALHWAGAFDEESLLRIARVRGVAMAELGCPTGAMLAIAAPWRQVEAMLNGEPLAVVAYNSPTQTVVAGETEAVKNFARIAAAHGWQANRLPVSHAFHTPLVGAAAPVLREQLEREEFSKWEGHVFSTVTGAALERETDLRELLCHQVTSPVRFMDALEAALATVSMLVEVGPGNVLAELARGMTELPVTALDAGGASLKGLLRTVGAAFALGAPINTSALFRDRFTRPFDLEWKPKFFANPCELAPLSTGPARHELHKVEMVRTMAAAPATDTTIDVVRKLVAERAELPVAAVRGESRMLKDLHFNSITVGQLVSEAARLLTLPRIRGLTDFAEASVAEIARALDEMKASAANTKVSDKDEFPPGVGDWVRAFAMELVETKPSLRPFHSAGKHGDVGEWKLFASENHPLAAPLREAFAQNCFRGVLVCLPEHPTVADIPLLLQASEAVLAMKGSPKFVVVQNGWGGSGFAKTLRLEHPRIATSVVNLPANAPRSVEWVLAEAMAATGFGEAHFDEEGRRFEPRLRLSEPAPIRNQPQACLGAEDVLLVTGGGKGIAAECALALSRETGVRLAIVGRGDPKADKELASNVSRFAAANAGFVYIQADVTDSDAVRVGVAEIERQLGPVTAVLHGAGVNTPRLISGLNAEQFQKTVAPKVVGLKNILSVVAADKLKILVAFGSIIARTGLPGEADYATANEWLRALTNQFQARHPGCRCLTLEWSVWSGAGMGERLGRIETLAQNGLTAISVDEGVRIFCELLQQPRSATSLIVAGRFGAPSNLKFPESERPLRRFLERTRVFYPGVELVVDTELSLQSDPYLADHVVQKQPLFPAVLGLEAMTQVAQALTGATELPLFENTEFLRPVAVPEKGKWTIRLAALRHTDGSIEICLRSEETDFQVDHFRAVCRFGSAKRSEAPRLSPAVQGLERLPLNPQEDLYDRILFHTGRFRRLRGYHLLKAKECVAEISPDDDSTWFGPYLPGEFVLGNPAARDAALHAIQACIPGQRVLPTGFERMVVYQVETGARFVRAKERLRDASHFVFDVEVTNALGGIVERWEGLRLRAVETITIRDALPPTLLAPYLERRLEDIAPDSHARIAFERGWREDRPSGTDAAIQRALGKAARVWRRPDGRPVSFGDQAISAAHARGFTLAVAAVGGVACDIEEVAGRAEALWLNLLGDDKLTLAKGIAVRHGESIDEAATRLWTAIECLKKSGQSANSPLVLESTADDGWVLLRSGDLLVATYVTALRGVASPLCVAVATRNRPAKHSFPGNVVIGAASAA
ncbi:MAG: SDR family NAD(P)-dependent oxidoreductase [Verrucomicrobia bacterium]|nr:SDR family NAD(P)-dependent oxidoreductase [Verrucomicrobiota bacterium]